MPLSDGAPVVLTQTGTLERAAQMQRRVEALLTGGASDVDASSPLRYFRESESAIERSYSRFGTIGGNVSRLVDALTPGIRPTSIMTAMTARSLNSIGRMTCACTGQTP